MPDTFKIKSLVLPRTALHREIHIDRVSNLPIYDSGDVVDTLPYSGFDFYSTTERNIHRNGGKRQVSLKPMSSKKILVDTDKVKLVRVYDFRNHKWVESKVPIQSERFLRTNEGSDRVEWPFTNDLTRDLHNPSPNGGNLIVVDNPSETFYREYAGPIQYIYPVLGLPTPSLPPTSSAALLVSSYSSEISALEDVAIRKLYSSIKNQPADLGTDFAEARQTIQLFAEASDRLAKFLLHLKKLNFTGAIRDILPRNKKDLANDFLAYRYGVSPLVQDIYGIAQEISSRIDGTFRRVASGRARDIIVRDTGSSTSFDSSDAEITVKYSCSFGVDSELLSMLERLGLTNPANVAWELVPFSFVVDWLLPIGPFLQTLTTKDHLDVKQIHRTVKVLQNRTIGGSIQIGDTPFLVSDYAWTYSHSTMHLERRVLSSLPDMPLPALKNPFSVGHAANFTALAIQRLSSRSKR